MDTWTDLQTEGNMELIKNYIPTTMSPCTCDFAAKKKRTLYVYYKKFAISISQWKIPYQNIWRAVESEPACVFEIGYQKYTTCNRKENTLSEIKFFLVKNHVFNYFSQFFGIFENSVLYLKYTAFQISYHFSVKFIKRNECQKQTRYPTHHDFKF